MATTTTKLGLTKPAYTDVVDVADLNDNADKLDAAAGFTIVANEAARPASPWTGQVIYQVDVTSSFMWDGTAWQPAGGGGGSIEISATAPASPSAGDLWWDSDNGNLYIYYDDGDSQQWVAANGPQVFVGTSAPAGYQGQLWFDSTTGKVYIYYDDGTSSQWVSAIGGSLAGSVVSVQSALKTDTFSSSVTTGANVEVTGLSITHALSNSSNKLVISAYFGVAASSAQRGECGIAVAKDGTLIGVGATAGSRTSVGSGGRVNQTSADTVIALPSVQFVYSPGDTSSHTYTVRAVNISGSTRTLYVNRSELDADAAYISRGSSALVIQEVAG